MLNGSENTVVGNYVGLSADGLEPVGNGSVGIYVTGSENIVGGAAAGAGNLVAASPELISIVGEELPGNRVQGNVLGTDRSGNETSLALAPTIAGISLSGTTLTTIGGTAEGEGNVIAGVDGLGESGVGIQINSSDDNTISGNAIGTDLAGAVDLGHHGAGIDLAGSSDDNTIAENTIAFTRVLDAPLTGSGVVIRTGLRNTVTGNRFRSNGGLAIDLAGDGPTPNDGGAADDADVGANDLLNFPIVDQASLSGSTLTVAGSVDSSPNVNEPGFIVELFSRDEDADDQDAGLFLGSIEVTTSGAGEGSFEVSLDGTGVQMGDFVTATATDGKEIRPSSRRASSSPSREA